MTCYMPLQVGKSIDHKAWQPAKTLQIDPDREAVTPLILRRVF